MTNLSFTSWTFNNVPLLSSTATDYDLAFVSAGVQFDTFTYAQDGIYYGKGQNSIKVFNGSTWLNDEYKKAEINGGDDVTNATLISLLPTIAVQTTQYVSKGNLRAYTEKIKTLISENSGTEVVANPTLAGTETDLTGLEVDGVKYKVPTMATSINFLTTAPVSANNDGLIFVVLSSEPQTRYAGYIYIITEE